MSHTTNAVGYCVMADKYLRLNVFGETDAESGDKGVGCLQQKHERCTVVLASGRH